MVDFSKQINSENEKSNYSLDCNFSVPSLRAIKILFLQNSAEEVARIHAVLAPHNSAILSQNNFNSIQHYLYDNDLDIIIVDESIGDFSELMQQICNFRKLMHNKYVPIIYLCNIAHQRHIAELLAIFDDVHFKPYYSANLISKIFSVSRFSSLYNQTEKQHKALDSYKKKQFYDLGVAKRLFENLAHPQKLNDDRIIYHARSDSLFYGDFLLAAKSLSGDICIFLGDFSGQGLTAGIGALTISGVFSGMVNKGFSLPQILSEIDKKLISILPKEVYCAACCIYVDERNGFVQSFNSGIPIALIQKGDGEVESITSNCLPLGLELKRDFESEITNYYINANDNILLLSDSSLKNSANEYKILSNLLASAKTKQDKALYHYLAAAYQNANTDSNYMSWINVKVDEIEAHFSHHNKSDYSQKQIKLDWSLQFCLGINSLRSFDPLPLLLHIVVENPALRDHRSEIYTVLAELYSNALEHGVLDLDSAIKNSPEGFERYYKERKSRLLSHENGYVNFKIYNESKQDGNRLVIKISDSGPGFDVEAVKQKQAKNVFSGRGLSLIYNICESIDYNDQGNEVTAIYKWH